MEVFVNYFLLYFQDWDVYDDLQKLYCENVKDEGIKQKVIEYQCVFENFV